MNFRPNNSKEIELNLTPMIDVVFLLLIFFMVTTTFNENSELKIELPETEAANPKEKQEAIALAINSEGIFYVNQQKVESGGLVDLIAVIQQQAKDMDVPKLVIHADANTPHQYVVTAMEASSRAGVSNVGFAATVAASE